MSNIDKHALREGQVEWLKKLADMEYCKSNPGHWLMSLKETNMLAQLALRSLALLDELEAAEKRIVEQSDYFSALVALARSSADKAMRKFPQPNYVLLKVAEEAGEVVQAGVHYAENRMTWDEVEGEIVQLLAMLIRLVMEGDQINGITPPQTVRATGISTAATDVLTERQRQMSAEGWTLEHDDEHCNGELAMAAVCYINETGTVNRNGGKPWGWPWSDEWWKPTKRRRDLVKAGALILAEIERLDRAAGSIKGSE